MVNWINSTELLGAHLSSHRIHPTQVAQKGTAVSVGRLFCVAQLCSFAQLSDDGVHPGTVLHQSCVIPDRNVD